VNFLAVAKRRLPHVLLLERPLFPREADLVRSRGDRDAARHPRVDEDARLVHVFRLDLVILGTADRGGVHLRAVDGDDEGVRRVVALDARVAFLDAADEAARQLVLAVRWKHMSHERAAAGAERQALDVSVLAEFAADRILGRTRPHARIADGERADALRGGEIALEEERRGLERRRDVVEAEVGAVARQERRHVDVERQQVANRVAVLGAVQAMHHVTPRLVPSRPCAIERVGEPGGEGGVLRFLRVRHALRRHRAHAQLAEHALPGRRVRQQIIEARRLEVHRLVCG
jgi:hypothetical protein